jgi:predicted DNA-binding ribbon-helix-helix protein
MAVKKRCIRIAGRKTSISLEIEFWDALLDLARDRSEPLYKVVATVNADKTEPNLTSALRVFILREYKERAKIVGNSGASPQPAGIPVAPI